MQSPVTVVKKIEYHVMSIFVEQAPAGSSHSGKEIYRKTCERYGVVPSSHFMHHMMSEELCFHHHQLSAAEFKLIATSLVVSGFELLC